MAFTTVVFPDPEPPAIPIISMLFCIEIPGRAGDDVVNFCRGRLLIFCVLWCAWEWDHVTDVAHTCHEEEETLKSETESAVRS